MSGRAPIAVLAIVAATALVVGTAPADDRPGAVVVGEVPAHWRALPELASPGRKALEALGADVGATADAWGDPAAGVYALLLAGHANAVPRPRNRVAVATDVHDRLRGVLEAREVTLATWTTTPGVRAVESRTSLEQFGQRGELVAWSGYDDSGRLVASAAFCFRNDRVAERTAVECREWLDSLRSTVALAPLDPDADDAPARVPARVPDGAPTRVPDGAPARASDSPPDSNQAPRPVEATP